MDSDLNKDDSSEKIERKKPKAVSESVWQRFKALEKRTDDVTRRSTEKRIKAIQRDAIKKVQEEITDPDDINILKEHDIDFGSATKRGKKKRKRFFCNSKPEESASTEPEPEEWNSVKEYLNVNEHLSCPSKDVYKPKCGLEEKIEEAIASGNIEKAEELSNELSTRQFGTKLSDAFSARKFMVEKQKERDCAKAKKKNKLSWGFEAKERWETKGNL